LEFREMLGERIAKVSPLNCDTDAPAGSAVRIPLPRGLRSPRATAHAGAFVTTFSHVGLYVNFFGTKGNITVNDCFYRAPGARLECATDDGKPTFVLDTKSDPDLLAHFDNYRREFEHFSCAILNKTQHHPSEDEVLSDALLLDTLKQNAATLSVPTPAGFPQIVKLAHCKQRSAALGHPFPRRKSLMSSTAAG